MTKILNMPIATIHLESSSQTQPRTGFLYLRWVLAFILAFAAGMKTYQLSSEGINAKLWRLAEVEVELALAIWLASGFRQRWAWRCAVACFTAFLAISLYEAIRGISSCGCVGELNVNPWFMAIADGAAVLALLKFRAPIQANSTSRWAPISAAVLFTFAGISLTNSLAQSKPITQLPATNPAAATTQPFFVAIAISKTEWLCDLGSVSPGNTVTIRFPLRSPIGSDVHIRGINADCTCVNLPKPPTVIKTLSTDVDMTFNAPTVSRPYSKSIHLTTDVPTLPPLELRINAQVSSP